MKLNAKLFDDMRRATRTLMGRGPAAATNAIQQALRQEAPTPESAPAMRDINPPPGGKQQAAPPPPAPEATASPADMFKQFMPDLMANLDKAGLMGRTGFQMPGMGAPAEVLPGKFIDGSFSNTAGTRSYKLYVPSSYAGEPVPLMVMLHGCTQDPDDFARGTQMNALAEEMGFLVVYPAQSQQANTSRCWNWFSAVDQQRGQGEPSIIEGITRQVMGGYSVDAGQVYVAGLSAGGAMAAIMGTLYPELYSGVGVHSGLPFASAHDLPSALAAMKGSMGKGAKGAVIPIIVFHGDKDTTVHPANGDEVIAQGAARVSRQSATEPGKVPDGHAYTRTLHHKEDGTLHAEKWTIHGAGHAWSGGSAHGSYTDGKGPDASREMLRFFRTRR